MSEDEAHDRITAEEAQRLLDALPRMEAGGDGGLHMDGTRAYWKVEAELDDGRWLRVLKTTPEVVHTPLGQLVAEAAAAARPLAAEVVRLTAERDQAQRIILETLTREAAFQRYHHQTVDALAAERDEAQMEYADCLRRRDELAAERDELRQAIWDACRILGMDTDGDPTPAAHVFPPLAELIVREATAARAAYDEALDDATDMEGRYREQVDELYRRLDGRCLNVGPNGERCMGAEGHDGGHWNSQTFPILGGAS